MVEVRIRLRRGVVGCVGRHAPKYGHAGIQKPSVLLTRLLVREQR